MSIIFTIACDGRQAEIEVFRDGTIEWLGDVIEEAELEQMMGDTGYSSCLIFHEQWQKRPISIFTTQAGSVPVELLGYIASMWAHEAYIFHTDVTYPLTKEQLQELEDARQFAEDAFLRVVQGQSLDLGFEQVGEVLRRVSQLSCDVADNYYSASGSYSKMLSARAMMELINVLFMFTIRDKVEPQDDVIESKIYSIALDVEDSWAKHVGDDEWFPLRKMFEIAVDTIEAYCEGGLEQP